MDRPFAIVTGGSSGIGRALAGRLVGRGMAVELWARGEERLEAAAVALRAAGGDVRTRVCDVASDEDVAAAAAETVAAGRGVDLLVANAGVPGRVSVLEADVEAARRVLDVNYLGVVRVTHALWPAVVAARGRIVTICSVAGTVAAPQSAPYNASKHAALAWSRALAAAAPRHGVRVLTVNPGPVATAGFPQTRLLTDPLRRRVVIDEEACAAAVVRALDRGRTEVFVPPWWRVPAVVQAVAPGLMARLVARAWR